jgi:hypothetical protein
MLWLIGLFLVVALAGGGLAVHEMRGRELPLPVGLLHGIAATIAITLLVVHDVNAPHDALVNSATAVFVLAAFGGLLLLLFRVQREPLAGFVVALHAGFAVIAIVLLTLGYLAA